MIQLGLRLENLFRSEPRKPLLILFWPQAGEPDKYGVAVAASSGNVARVDKTACEGCAKCQDFCPFKAIQVNGTAVVNRENCMGCGVCAGQCPNDAMKLERDAGKGIPLDVRMLAGGQALS